MTTHQIISCVSSCLMSRFDECVNKLKKNSKCCQLSTFNVDNTNSIPQFLSVSVILANSCTLRTDED
jgi:hypothetical protein